MAEEKKVKDIMIPMGEYHKVGPDEYLCDILSVLKRNHENIKTGAAGSFHKTLFVWEEPGGIIGKISMYDIIRGLVPEGVKRPELSRAYYSVLSSRAMDASEEVGGVQERFKWLHSTFVELVKEEAHKKVKDIMSPVHPLLEEDDTINKAVYIMFKEGIRQPLVVRGEEVVGVMDLMAVFDQLLEVVGPECFVTWEE